MSWKRQYLICALMCVFWAVQSTQYADLSYYSLNAALDTLKGHYASISNANELYGLPFSKEGPLTCSPYIVSISEIQSMKQDSGRPQVMISGEIHGDERVGPGVSVALSQLLVWSAQCTIHRIIESCNSLDLMQVTPAQRNWLTLLATRRETIVVPTANCLGYMRNVRSDGTHDPNRDYPYSRNDDRCFKSSSAKLFKALMETTIVQMVVTFHGGMVALGYEWGSRNHLKPRDSSPDDHAHQSIADRMQLYAGSFRNEKPYPVGRINTLIYPVDGGMEDWLYAAGWDKSQLHHCAGTNDFFRYTRNLEAISPPHSLHSLPHAPHSLHVPIAASAGASERAYGASDHAQDVNSGGAVRRRASLLDISSDAPAENRAVVFLVETSDRKKPADSTLGGSEKILDPEATEQNGHIPRNVRLSLAAIDMAQPYVCVNTVKVLYQHVHALRAHSRGGKGTSKSARAEERLRRAYGSPGVRKLQDVPTSVNSTASGSPASTDVPTGSPATAPPPPPANSTLPPAQNTHLAAAAIEVEWYVGGASTVDCTFLSWHLPPPPGSSSSVPNADPNQDAVSTVDWTKYLASLEAPGMSAKFLSNCKRDTGESPQYLRAGERHRDRGYLQQSFPIIASASFTGESRWKEFSSNNGDAGVPSGHAVIKELNSSTATYAEDDVLKPQATYKAAVQPAFHMVGNTKAHSTVAFPPGRYLLVAWSMVDQNYGEPQQGYPVDLGPQSHLANVRTNPRYHKAVGDRAVQGRLFWPSDPLEVVVSANGTYYVASTVTHGAWWDRQHHGNPHADDTYQLYATIIEPEKVNSTLIDDAGHVATELLKNIFDTAAYLPAGEMSGNANRMYGISFGLLLITGVCCVVLYYQWRRSSIYTQMANNKHAGVRGRRTIYQSI